MGVINREELSIPIVKKHPFRIQSMNAVITKELPEIKKLIGDLIYPEEQTILFGGSGVGKSIFAMMVARAISKGEHLNFGNGIVLLNECEPINVIYYDFELSERQIQKRYNANIDYVNLYWANVTRGEILETEPKKVFEQLKSGAEDVEAKCMIIDNISAISQDIEKGENAKAFMNELWKLARDEGYTIIVLAHTPKIKEFEPININHLKGSSVLGQLCDNIIAINNVNADADDEVYFKQIKVRNSAKQYGANNVIHAKKIVEYDVLIHKAIGIANEIEMITNVSGELGHTSHRMLFVYAYLYYGTYRKAESILKQVNVENCSVSNINYHVDTYKQSDSKSYKELENKSVDELKFLLDGECDAINCLPLKDGHALNNDEDVIPF